MPPQSPSESPVSFNRNPEHGSKEIRQSLKASKARSSEPSMRSDGSVANSATAPSSVYLGSPLNRELSDLSGSACRGSKIASVPGHIYDDAIVKGPWRVPFILSHPPPLQQQQKPSERKASDRDATIFTTTSNDVVEVVQREESRSGRPSTDSNHEHARIPVILLLMDPTSKVYECMKLWASSVDSVRDVVQTMQQSIPDKWKQAYDGLFQMRGNKLSQLIHILKLEKYEVQPYECFVAKPWSMSSTLTVAYATSLVRHLTNIGMLSSSDSDSSKRMLRPMKSIDATLILSKKAQSRIYSPEGVLNHHHAVQFVTFSPALDPNRLPVDTIHSERDDANSSVSLSNSVESDPILKLKNVRNSTSAASIAELSTLSPGSRCGPQHQSQHHHASPSSPRTRRGGKHAPLYPLETTAEHQPRRSFGHMVSKLNCCRKEDKRNDPSVVSAVLTLTEEQQRRWSTFDITGPIAEDYSVAGYSAQSSTVSMSAPLLLTNTSKAARSRRATNDGTGKRPSTLADF